MLPGRAAKSARQSPKIRAAEIPFQRLRSIAVLSTFPRSRPSRTDRSERGRRGGVIAR